MPAQKFAPGSRPPPNAPWLASRSLSRPPIAEGSRADAEEAAVSEPATRTARRIVNIRSRRARMTAMRRNLVDRGDRAIRATADPQISASTDHDPLTGSRVAG